MKCWLLLGANTASALPGGFCQAHHPLSLALALSLCSLSDDRSSFPYSEYFKAIVHCVFFLRFGNIYKKNIRYIKIVIAHTHMAQC